jgi:phosphoribosylanthranilate isomerase
MQATRRPRLKVCCIADRAEAGLAIELGAHALGLVSAMPSGPGVIDEDTIREVATACPPAVATFLLTSEVEPRRIAEQALRTRVSTVQIVDRLSPGAHAELRALLPGLKLVQVVHVVDAASVDEALAVAAEVDALLLDSGNPNLPVKELGGTGRRHDWALSKAIRKGSPVPLFLAGGLRPENVAEAIAEVGPYGLDICSGVRRDGRLDRERLGALVAAIESARA